MGGPGVFHQHHDVLDPPVQHLEDIVRNARTFFDRWRFWPMDGWLRAFAELGLIRWSEDEVALLHMPSQQAPSGGGVSPAA
jgi:hypothetical protein